MRATFCNSLKSSTSNWTQGTSTFNYPQSSDQEFQLDPAPSNTRDDSKVDCDNAVAFCDFGLGSVTYYLEMDWYGTRYVVPSAFDSSTSGFLKFDASNQKFYVSGSTYTVDRHHTGPFDLYLCYNNPTQNCSQKHVLTYNDNCN